MSSTHGQYQQLLLEVACTTVRHIKQGLAELVAGLGGEQGCPLAVHLSLAHAS